MTETLQKSQPFKSSKRTSIVYANGVYFITRFVETAVFTRALLNLLSDDEYRSLQLALMLRPAAGDIISGSGGLRKFRWSLSGKGKRGGTRLIYYWQRGGEVIYMLFIYAKSRQEDLTPEQLKTLRKLVKENLK